MKSKKMNTIIIGSLLAVILVLVCSVVVLAGSAKGVIGLHCKETGTDSIYVYWKEAANRSYYLITVKQDGEQYGKKSYKVKTNEKTFKKLEPGHKYSFTVVTVLGSSKSMKKTVSLRLKQKLETPKLKGKSTGRRCELTWNEVKGTDYYKIEEKDCQTDKTKTYKVKSSDDLIKIFDNKAVGEKFSYRIRALNNTDANILSGDWSEAVTVKTKKTTIGQAASNYDGKAGDGSGREVATANWKYSSSTSSVRNWMYVFRYKDPKKAELAATMCEKAIANDNIGYCSNGTKTYGSKALQKVAAPLNWDLSKVNVKTGCACGDLVMLCTRYAGIDCKYVGDGLGCAKELKRLSKDFDCYTEKKYVADDALLHRGDILISAHSSGKNNHVCMVL